MFAMSRFEFRDMIRRGMEEKWEEIDKKWFCSVACQEECQRYLRCYSCF